MDTELIVPITNWNIPNNSQLVVGKEFDFRGEKMSKGSLSSIIFEKSKMARPLQFVQWTIGATPGHKVLAGLHNEFLYLL